MDEPRGNAATLPARFRRHFLCEIWHFFFSFVGGENGIELKLWPWGSPLALLISSSEKPLSSVTRAQAAVQWLGLGGLAADTVAWAADKAHLPESPAVTRPGSRANICG